MGPDAGVRRRGPVYRTGGIVEYQHKVCWIKDERKPVAKVVVVC